MPKATGDGMARSSSASPARAGGSAVESCENEYANLERELDSSLDEFVSAASAGRGFAHTMEKIESQLAHAERMKAAQSDLELNEAVVIADKLEGEIAEAGSLALGAVLAKTEEEWAEEFESAKNSLDRLSVHMRKIRADSKGGREGSAIEARSALLSFRREAKSCREKMAKLRARFSDKKHPFYSKVELARKKVHLLRTSVAKAFLGMSKSRLKKKIGEAKAEISAFMQNYPSGRIFVDHKHLTLAAGNHKNRMTLTEAVRFALEEMAPVEKSLAKIGRSGTVLLGSFEREGNGMLLRFGERTVAGDSIIYRERTYRL